jgi:SAM-dependent methyltransferase
MSTMPNSWTKFYTGGEMGKQIYHWPCEPLIRIIKGGHLPGGADLQPGRSAFEVGFGSGNNLVFLASLGLQLSGIEVSEAVVEKTKGTLAQAGIGADLRVGTNTAIPFADASFDCLVSWNVIHYENTDDAMQKAVAEYARVLKPGASIILSTIGAQDTIMTGAQFDNPLVFRVGLPGDFRRGEKLFYFGSAEVVERYFKPYFREIHVGRALTQLRNITHDCLILTAARA